MRKRPTKAQVEDLFAAMDGGFDDVKAATSDQPSTTLLVTVSVR